MPSRSLSLSQVGLAVEIPSGLASKNNLNHDTFFEFLLNKDQAYQEFPSERFNVESFRGPNLGQVVTNTGCFLKDILLFDPVEFGITLKDAKAMAVATRKLIETTFLALLDSGIDYRGRNVGCYMSADIYEPRGSFAGYPYMVANKVSYHLDLLGPSVPVDTACSSTMTGLHLAVQALRSGDCESAVVGGCQLNHRKYSQGGVLAPDGKCKPFDISADGLHLRFCKLFSDLVVLRKTHFAKILGTGINSTGAAGPVSAPVAEAQMDAMHRAYTGTGRQPSEVDYIELHATGTAAGDPTEANWVGSEFQRDSELLVGSVKGNIGHLEIMSFLASVSKVCSIFKSRIIPPTVNLNVPNPAILWEKHKMRAPVDCTPFNPRHPSGQGLVSMCSSGIGGSNGHAILEGPPVSVSKDRGDHQKDIPILFIASGLSARSAAAVGETLEGIMLDAPRTLSALSNIYGRRARQMSWRSAAVYDPNQIPVRFPPPRFSPRQKRPIVFVFSGQGPQYFEMGRQLFKHYTIFRHSIEQMDQIYVEATGTSLIRSTGLFVDDPTTQNLSEMWPVSVTLPALAMLQMALCDLLAAAGVVPDVVIGHSAGETSAMYACGAATQATALRLAIARGIAMSAVEGAGSMAAINCSSSAAESLIAEVLGTIPSGGPGGVLEIACYNAQDSVALSGTSDLIDRAVTLAKNHGFLARKLRTNVPFHSSLLEPTKEQYEKSLRLIFDGNAEHRPRIPTYSSFTGQLWQGSFSAEYFWSNTRMPVLFSQGISALLQDIPKPTFLELGPHPVLQSYISSFDASLPILAPMRRPKLAEGFHEVRMLLSAIGELVVHGFKLTTPPYPFSRKPVSYEPDSSAVLATARARKGPLNDFNLGSNSLTHPALAQHIIRNEPIMPAAGYLEMAFEFDVRYLWNVRFDSILPLLPDRVLRVQVSQEGHLWSVRSWTSGSELNYFARRPPRLHAQGYMSRLMPRKWENLDLDAIRNRCQVLDIGGMVTLLAQSIDSLALAGFYQQIAYFAQYGKAYQRVTGCYIADSEGLIRVRGSEEDLTNEGDYHLHPVILDSCLHALVHPAFTRNSDTSVYYLPSSVEAVTLHTSFRGRKLPATLYAYAKIREWDPEFLCGDLSITDAGGLRICTLIGLRVSIHSISAHVRSEIRYKLVYQPKANQQHATFPALPWNSANISRPLIIEFTLENILHCQQTVRECDSVTLWISATADRDNGAALGFSRSLRREMVSCEVFLVLFDPVWLPEARLSIIGDLSGTSDVEPEVCVDAHGHVYVPRIVRSPDVASKCDFDSNSYWVRTPEAILQVSPPAVPAHHALVRVTKLSSNVHGLRVFVGHISNAGCTPWSTQELVLGAVASEQIGNHFVVHEGQIVPAVDHVQPELAAAFIFLAMAIGIDFIRNPARLQGRRFLITNADEPMGGWLTTILSSLGVIPERTCVAPTEVPRETVRLCHVILSGYSSPDDLQVLQSHMNTDALVRWWNGPTTSQEVRRNPWIVGDLLRQMSLLDLPLPSNLDILCSSPEEYLSLAVEAGVKIQASLFEADKSYLLIGGIGSLGLRIAWWMHQKGARHLILTSRSGEASLNRDRNTAAIRLLTYLRAIPDLSLRLEGCDAASASATSDLVNSAFPRVGGCILLGVVFSDRAFLSHTVDSFYIPFAAKSDAFRALEHALPINSLDFLLVLSSVTGLFGSLGQTNYSGANTAVDALAQAYPRAFSIVAPAILDSHFLINQKNLSSDSRFKTWTSWGITSQQLCDCIEHAIFALNQGTSDSMYLPEVSWEEIKNQLGVSPMYDHFLEGTQDGRQDVARDDPGELLRLSVTDTVRQIVLKTLDVDTTEFSIDTPFTSYGLDSLFAGRLSFMLRPYLSITQVQLLADMSLTDVYQRIEQRTQKLGPLRLINPYSLGSSFFRRITELNPTL
ncbi:polyketide synthase [Mycena polygramma]|nr:polyketide synthase [Mycena polygramma]